MNLYEVFQERIPKYLEDFHPANQNAITFLNPYSFLKAESNVEDFKSFDIIASDGILMVILVNLFKIKKYKVGRFSFDMTSIARYVFSVCQKEGYSLYFIGTKENLISKAIENIKTYFPKLHVTGYRHGYFNSESEKEYIIEQLVYSKPDIVIIGMGTPHQEEFGKKLRVSGYKGAIYTCGGFLHQSAMQVEYYPKIIDKLNLRLPYRMWREKGLFRRSIINYPKFCFKFSLLVLKEKNNNRESVSA